MPFTPFHLGPSSLISIIFHRYLDVMAFLIGSVIVDLEPFLVIVLGLRYPLHGYFHTFLGATIASIPISLIMEKFSPTFERVCKSFSLPQELDRKKTFLSTLFGTYSHVLLDSPLYYDIHPFFPLEENPLFLLLSPFQVYALCSYSFILSLFTYVIYRFYTKK
ncbi:MAG: hypothetical protein ACTSVF_04710 [Candidatus Asgardarchaeia archaeon]